MQIVQSNTLQAFKAVQAFLDTHATTLGEVATGGARKKLDAQVDALSAHVMTQSGSNLAAQGATQKQYTLRHALLYGHMAPIARIAAADLPDTPELLPLRMPKSNGSSGALYAAAVGMADAADGYATVFVDGGLPQDFVARLRAAADALDGSLNTRAQSRGARQGATQGLTTTERRARKALRVLDALVRFALKDDPALLANWAAVKRPQTKTGKATGAATPATPSTPVAIVAPATPATPGTAAAPAAPAAALTLVTTQD